jgi:hypothetical protein
MGRRNKVVGNTKPPTTFLSAFETVRKYLIRFDDNTKAALRNIKFEVYRVQQELIRH